MDTNSRSQSVQDDRSSRNSGSITGDKIKMLDITRDKPIKICVKVAVPVRDHPKFNFVGKLLGPKGNSLKRLQEDTMCKMAVLGRGSMRDRKKEEELRSSGEPRYAHLSEDLHVEITTFAAPAEAHARIAYALAEVRRFLVPDYHDDIRQEQMLEMQAISSSSSTSSSSSSTSTSSPTSQIHHTIKTDQNNLTTINIIPSELKSNDISCAENNIQETSSVNMDISPASTTSTSPASISVVTSATTNPTLSLGTSTIQRQLYMASTLNDISSSVTGGLPSNQSTISVQNSFETATPTLAVLDPSTALLHPALRGIKAVNIAGNLSRKRPLLGGNVPRSGMNPTKRTVMSLLARARSTQAVHAAAAVRNAAMINGASHIPDPFQMIASPLLLPQTISETMIASQRESLTQGV